MGKNSEGASSVSNESRPYLIRPDSDELAAALDLIRASFAYMEGVIDPPSSVHRLDLAVLADAGDIWAIGAGPVACMVVRPDPPALYVGKIAVARAHRGTGLARALLDHAEDRAWALGLDRLRLQTRVELAANHAAFAALGFAKTGETAHEGYDRPTSITMERPLN